MNNTATDTVMATNKTPVKSEGDGGTERKEGTVSARLMEEGGGHGEGLEDGARGKGES